MKSPVKPKALKHIVFQASRNGCLLLNRKTEEIHSLNTTAAFIWTYCDGKHGVAQIEAALKQHWNAPQEKIRGEVEKTLKQLKMLRVLSI